MRDDVSWGSSFLKLKRNGGDGKKKLIPPSFRGYWLFILGFLCSVWPVCTKIKLRKEFRQPGHQFFFLIFRLNFAHAWTPLSLFFSFFFLSFVLLAMRKERDESMKQFFSPRPSDFNSFHLFDARNHSDMNASAFDALLLFFFPPPSFFFNRLNFRSNKSRLFWTFSKIWRIYRGKF